MTPQVSCIDVCIMPTAVVCPKSLSVNSSSLPNLFRTFFLKIPCLVPKGVLMTGKMSHIDVILMWMDVVDFLTYYLSKCHHFRIYLGLSP